MLSTSNLYNYVKRGVAIFGAGNPILILFI